jgi:hypothetical protein
MASVASTRATTGYHGYQHDSLGGDAMTLPKLIWMSPKIFYYAGLYLKLGNKRYRILKVGPR